MENVEKPKLSHKEKLTGYVEKINWDFAQNKNTAPLDKMFLQIFTENARLAKTIFFQKSAENKNIKKSRNQKKSASLPNPEKQSVFAL